MEILRLTDRTEVALPEATPNGIFATALRWPPLPPAREHGSVGYVADLRDPMRRKA